MVLVDVAWPDRREDVAIALDVLAGEPPSLLRNGRDPRKPDVTDAVHWLVDDTGWDSRSPAESVGLILRDDAEAGAIAKVVAAIVEVSRRQGATAPDAAWFADEAWPRVRASAAHAVTLLRS
ncbi:MAG TPA: hypothetical protein VFJ85_15245 [Acidimicrobiales bacterium]|nr:hypothetical protein [Acidimicrobiales bacterium]